MFENGNTLRRAWPEYGIALFARKFLAGESHTFPQQIAAVGESPNVTILPIGLIRTWNENRATHLDVPGRPGRIYGGLLLPGQYTIEALEDTVYVCLAVLDQPTLDTYGVPMFHLNSVTLQAGASEVVRHQDGYRAVICMFGECKVNGQTLRAGHKHLILGGEVDITADAYCEISTYREGPKE